MIVLSFFDNLFPHSEKIMILEDSEDKEQIKRAPPPFIDADQYLKDLLVTHGYEYMCPLGHGGFSSVHKIMSTKYNCEFVVKISRNETKNEGMAQEINALMKLNHPNIISMYEYFEDDENVFLVLEYCCGGSLDDMVKAGSRVKPPRLYLICKQVLCALEYCHQKNIAHRDIKPANILLDVYGRPKLADFGLSSFYDNNQLIRSFAGSRPFMPPEIINGKKHDPFKADIWSLGITFFMIGAAKSPWPSNKMKVLKSTITNGMITYPPVFNHHYIQALKSMCQVKPKNRLSIQALLELQVFNDFDEGKAPLPTCGSRLQLSSFKTGSSKGSKESLIPIAINSSDSSYKITSHTPQPELVTGSAPIRCLSTTRLMPLSTCNSLLNCSSRMKTNIIKVPKVGSGFNFLK